MTITYDENGIIIQTLSEILDERETNLQTFLGDDFTISGDNAIANLQLADADRESDIQALLLYIAMQLDPDQAEGIWLNFICALNNIIRYSPEKTLIPITVTGIALVSKTAGEVTIVDEDTDEYYINESAFTIDEGGTVNVVFQATSFGDISSASSHAFSLKTASSGITSLTWDNAGDYVIGRYAETDIELRARREQTIELTATSTLASIKANVSEVTGVTYLNVYENYTDSEVDTIPAKAFEVVVLGGDAVDIATAIQQKRPIGIQAYGVESEVLTDDDGNETIIGYTRPTEVPVEFTISMTMTSEQTEEWENSAKEALVSYFEDIINVGDDIYVYNFYCILNNYDEIINITNFQVEEEVDSSNWASSLAIGKREIATLAVEDITIIQNT